MPISENELMWARTLPEEVEADSHQSARDQAMQEPATDADSTAETQEAAASAADTENFGAETSVVRVEGASRLEATLARLEMNSLQIKLHLDLLEERLGRIEPGPLQGPREATAASHLGAPPVASAEAAEKTVPQRAVAEYSVSADPPLREARNDRWSHLMGPEVEARVPMFPAPLPVDARPTQEIGSAPPQAREPEPRSAVPEQRFAASVLAAAATADVSPVPSAVPPMTREAPAGYPTDMQAMPAPVAFPERRAELDEREGERRSCRRMSAVERFSADPDARTPTARVWRGYRVRALVLAALLLVLAAIPLAIWWRLSVEARDADAGDAAPTSQADPAAVAAPVGKSETTRNVTRHIPPVRTSGGALASLGNAGRATGNADRSEGHEAAAPVVRVPPAALTIRSAPPTRAPVRPAATRTSSGTATVGGTAIALARPSTTSDEVPGTSGVRVRVPAGVMAGHLLPTGDVGELSHGSGEVVAAMFISNTGRVEEVQVISGTHGLRDAAMRAMRNWRYEPYVQDGVRVPVVTTASIRFDGAGSDAQ